MDSVLLEEWVRDVNKTFQAEWRKVALIIDNCPAHPIIENLSHLKLVFLPPNTTSVTQPMNQGVIRCLKAHYKKRLVKLILRSLDSNKPLPKVSLLTTLQLLVSAWNEVSQTTIVNWFNEAKISEKDQTIAISDEDDPFKEIDKNPKELQEKKTSLVQENMTAEDFATANDVVITAPSTLTDEEILQEATQTEKDEVEDIEDDDEELVAPSTRDVENSFEKLKNLSLFSEKKVTKCMILLINLKLH